ncbi:MAG: HlyD family efflux transporter periplasmic adaptor subunit [Gammaproteobacteria bacterium]|nr:HlyD family efflux transporter periplasmic adaptor subunit [Gammaproteobacteria bacterium]
MTGLFRKEVYRARQENWMGTIMLTTPKMVWPMTLLATAIVVTGILFMSFGSYTGKQHVQGQLVPDSGLLAVAARLDGTVTELLIREGQQVQANQALAVISSSQIMPSAASVARQGRSNTAMASLETGIEEQLQYQQSKLQADLQALTASQTQALQDLHKRSTAIEQQLDLVDAQLAIRQKQLQNAQDLLARVAQVEDQKYLSALQMQQYRNAVFEAETQLGLTQLQQLDYQQQLAATQQDLQRLPLELEDKRRDIQRNIATIAQSLLQNEARRSAVVVAPRDGAVSGLAIAAGQAVTANQRLLSIIPADAELQAELWVPDQAVGMLTAGQQIAIRYHAFPYQDFGLQYGEIIEIAGSSITPEQINNATGLELKAPAYRVLARLDLQSMPLAQGALKLRANMTLDADLLQHRQRLYQMLLPIINSNGNGKTQADADNVDADTVAMVRHECH